MAILRRAFNLKFCCIVVLYILLSMVFYFTLYKRKDNNLDSQREIWEG